MFIAPLGITAPLAGFNGGTIVTPAMAVLERHLLEPSAARQAVEIIRRHGAGVWVFSGEEWLVLRNGDDRRVALEQRTVQFAPVVVGDFGQALEAVGKIVGVSEDGELLSRYEEAARAALGEDAAVSRSQPYYLDITHRQANKGAGLLALARLMDVPPSQVAVIGDGPNDVAMFRQSGLSIAMGNASREVKEAADFVADSNEDEGFAKAMEQIVLPAAFAPAGE